MKERPITFTSADVRALLAGTKTQTRRAIAGQVHPIAGVSNIPQRGMVSWTANDAAVLEGWRTMLTCPFGVPGDRLWVRETWSARVDSTPVGDELDVVFVRYDADGTERRVDETVMGIEWTLPRSARVARAPSIHMPRWASRITLEITDVRVERLQAITEEDARAEGCGLEGMPLAYALSGPSSPRQMFAKVWDSTNGRKAPWSSNPWVWAISFRKVDARTEREAAAE